jgi:predicted RNase H-like HicB family nuclease
MEIPMKYEVVLKKSDEGYSVHCPGLPGCWSQGDTEAEALSNIAEAIGDYLIAVRDFGDVVDKAYKTGIHKK